MPEVYYERYEICVGRTTIRDYPGTLSFPVLPTTVSKDTHLGHASIWAISSPLNLLKVKMKHQALMFLFFAATEILHKVTP